MSYQVLARKYRPKNFATLVGQEHVVRALSHALATQRLHHAYLFTGTRGVGKTTLSRILAKCFNCIGPDGQGGITAEPCGQCEVCSAIDAGRFVDYIEMDAASNRGVDEMAQLLEQAIYAPSNARFKVYMIDEVHMLTNTAFNAMLKTLEEPPPHIKFILATTDPQKIPVTVLSRCLQFNLKQMPPGHIVGHLQNLLQTEQVEFETPALRLLAQGAHGSMRDALSLTDQAIAYAAGKVTLDAVQGMLGALDQSFLLRLLDALAREDGPAMLAVADEMAARSLSYNTALQDLATLLHQLALAQIVPQALPEDIPEREEVMRLAGVFDAEDVQLYYQIAILGRNELGLAPDEYAGFAMTLLRMLAFAPGNRGGGGGGGQHAPTPPAPAPALTRPAQAAANQAAPAPASSMAAPAVNAAPAAAPQHSAAAPAAQSAAANGQKLSPARLALQAALGKHASPAPSRAAAPVPAPAPAPTPAPAPVAAEQAAVRVTPAPRAPQAAPQSAPKAEASRKADDVPPWVDEGNWQDEQFFASQQAPEFALDVDAAPASAPPSAVSGQQAQNKAAPALPQEPIPPYEAQPLPGLDWDGDWPALAASLQLSGFAQEAANNMELAQARFDGNTLLFELRCITTTHSEEPYLDKIAQVLTQRFARPVRLQITEVTRVWHTAHVRAELARAARQREAEAEVQNDPFVKQLQADFGAFITPDSVHPIDPEPQALAA
ncbi:DNA polymerase III subunit gamma/tau [Massilia sp. W12]|uniref:DNA polymerase III subunit gamma/tau n=1 Tax=Massilia sp. W12 TaxID=3126507 RepID=UPI0030CA8F05